MDFVETLKNLWESTGLAQSQWQNYVMLFIACVLFYLAIVKKFEPLLLVPIAFGMFLVNIPGAYNVLYAKPVDGQIGGLFHYLGLGVEYVIFPPLIFLGIGAMTDFGPLIANPKSMLLGAAAQLGIFLTFILAVLFGFDMLQAASISIIGGADGPTTIYLAQKLLGGTADATMISSITIAAYSYMALIPIIQPPFMKLLTTKKERTIVMKQLRVVSKKEKVLFSIIVSLICGLVLPSALPLVGMMMLGNLLKECAVTERLAKTASNELINIVTILLGVIVGSKAIGIAPEGSSAASFIDIDTLLIVALGLFAFIGGTCGGILMAKIMNLFSKNKINPLIGSAGVSAIPMAARVSHNLGRQYDPDNYLLMHAMGPNVAGSIGSAVAAGILLAIF